MLRPPTLGSLLLLVGFRLELMCSIGPLNAVFFRFAKTRPGDDIVPLKARSSNVVDRFNGGGVVRTRRTLEGKADAVGVAGSTLTELCGDRAIGRGLLTEDETTEFDVEEVDEVLE